MRVQAAHEVTFSVNLSLLVMAVFYVVYPYVRAFEVIAQDLEAMDRAISRYLNVLPSSTGQLLRTAGVPKDVMTGGYFAFFIPGLVLAFCLWMLLRLFRRTRLAHQILRSVAGITALSGAPLWQLWVSYLAGHWWWWSAFVQVQFYEVVAVLCCVVMYFCGKWPIPTWGSILLLLGHYAFWLWQFRFSFRELIWGWGGSVAITPVVGLIAGLMWVLYLSESSGRKDSGRVREV